MGKRILSDFASTRLKASQNVEVIRCVPDVALRVDAQSIGMSQRTGGQIVFVKAFGLGIETSELSSIVFAKPDDSLGINLNPTGKTVFGGDGIPRHLERLPIDLDELPWSTGYRKPEVSLGIVGKAVGVARFPIVGKLPGFRIKTAEGLARHPNVTPWIKSHSVLRTSVLDPVFAW